MNFEKRYRSPIVRLRFFNAYGPGEYYHKYRSVVCLFTYRALHDLPYTVYKNYHRVFMYIDDFTPTLATVCENFKPGEVYNIGGTEFVSVQHMSSLLLDYLGKSDELVTYLGEDKHNTLSKRPDVSKAARDFGHDPKVTLEEGIPATVEWMRSVYLSDTAAAPS
jgi:dTDP-glucose 4,6-dehydratase